MRASVSEVLVGCPVSNRAWSLPAWFEHVHRACECADLHASFIFAGAWVHDLDTFGAIAPHRRRGHPVRLINLYEDALVTERSWCPSRYEHMVAIRNRVLQTVRQMAPPLFLSLDSDILLHPEALVCMMESVQRFAAVGSRLYMTSTGVHYPSYGMMTPSGSMRRPDSEGVFKVDVIMAAKLMTPAAYAVDYEPHCYGEDIGWSLACKRAGLKLGWDGRVISKHLMEPRMLESVDRRVGW